jgi:thioredoxin 1
MGGPGRYTWVRAAKRPKDERTTQEKEWTMSEHVLEIDDNNFQTEVLNSEQPVLVDFWAPWCQPCRRIAPMIDELASENLGKAKVVKVNIDDAQNTMMQYDVQSIPTLIIFQKGEPVQRFQGISTKAHVQEALDAATK